LKSAKANISAPVYRYNAETCRYERTKRSWVSTVFYSFGVLITAVIMLAGMLLLHDYFFDSENEIRLTLENQALKRNSKMLDEHLQDVKVTLVSLEEKDQLLHKKFFGSPEAVAEKKTKDHSDILFFNISDYPNTLHNISDESEVLLRQSQRTSQAWGSVFHLNSKSLEKIESLPVTVPLQEFQISNLLSGFGLRIHPFHKGLYKHQGVDIALPRGTSIIAPAKGVVTIAKQSDLQAGYGTYIEIDHGNGIITRYAHLDEIKIKIGQHIKRGDILGVSGNSGGSIAPHLHYEIIRNGVNVDPVNYFVTALNAENFEQLKNVSSIQNQSLD
jgi:murein DD-endopeptidase MepM/ murein hydrolase activator NlpD